MDGIMKAVGDSFWDDHSPPCGYNCRCSLISLSQDQVEARGGETHQIPTDARADPGFGSRPEIGLNVLDERIGRAMLDTHGTLQQEILTWYNEIAQEKIIERVQNFVPDYDARADELQPFLEESDGLLMEHEAVALRWYTADGYANLNAYLRGGAGDGAAAEGAKRKFAGVAYSGDVIEGHWYWDRVVFDLSTTKAPQKLPMLMGHDRDKIVGFSEKVDHRRRDRRERHALVAHRRGQAGRRDLRRGLPLADERAHRAALASRK
jgi:hypothetical protein